MPRRLGYFALIILSLIAGSLWSPEAKKVLNPVLVSWWPGPLSFDVLRRVEHISAFTIASLLAISVWRTAWEANWALLFLMATAVSLELAQHWLYNNRVEWWDVRDDLIGVVAGYLLAAAFRGLLRKRGVNSGVTVA